MSNQIATYDVLEAWATAADGPVALRLRQPLEPVEGSRIVFPPTYADVGYNIDTLSDGTRLATIDSVGSQANRLEPLFKSESRDPKQWLVPQIEIIIRREPCGACEACQRNMDDPKKAKKECTTPREITRSLLDLAHRAADAVVQSTPELFELIGPAFKALQKGDAGPLCTIAPTSLVFGVWDSRETGEKRPRLVRSTIRAWDVDVIHAAAQFNSIWKLLDEEQKDVLAKEAKAKKVRLSEKGLADAPGVFRQNTKAPQYINGSPNPEARVLGGVLVRGRIEREVTINLVALRGLRGANEEETAAIRKYLLGLSLTAAIADTDLFLREGCLLRYAEKDDLWYQVPRRGEPLQVALDAATIRDYVDASADHFRAKWPEVFKAKWPSLKYEFDLDEAKKLLAKKTVEEETTPE